MRSKVLETEKRLEGTGLERSNEAVRREAIASFKKETMPALGREKHEEAERQATKLLIEKGEVELKEMVNIAEEKGVLHALTVVEKLRGWRLEDDFHDSLVTMARDGLALPGMKEKGPIYQALHMTLLEVEIGRAHV